MRFKEIIDLKHWQKVQDFFSSLLGISLKTIDSDGELLSDASNLPAICSETVFISAAARKKCSQWYPKLAVQLRSHPDQKYYEYVCPIGLINFAMPVILDKEPLGYLIAGPLVIENSKRDVHLTQKIQDACIDEGKFFECFNKLPSVNAATIGVAIEFLNSITLFMSRLMELHSAVGKADIVVNKEKVAELLRIFLDMAMKLCDAERGSVMVFEKSTQELSINDAKGLSDEVVSETKLKPGEGIAGLTIERRKSLFLSDQLSDREIRLRMHRPKIKSAFVIPVFYKNEILGVISVGTVKKPNRFCDNLMELLNELVGMALEKFSLD